MRIHSFEKGQVTAEWLIATGALMAALFIPFNGEQSTLAMFVEAVKEFHANSMYSLSLP